MSAALVPELLVTEIEASLRFWRDHVGFQILYDRPDEGFAYLKLGGAAIMLEERSDVRRNWVTASLKAPYGRGINFQIECNDVAAAAARFTAADWSFFLPMEEKTYQTGTKETRVRQFIVQDPDGYLVRLSETL